MIGAGKAAGPERHQCRLPGLEHVQEYWAVLLTVAETVIVRETVVETLLEAKVGQAERGTGVGTLLGMLLGAGGVTQLVAAVQESVVMVETMAGTVPGTGPGTGIGTGPGTVEDLVAVGAAAELALSMLPAHEASLAGGLYRGWHGRLPLLAEKALGIGWGCPMVGGRALLGGGWGCAAVVTLQTETHVELDCMTVSVNVTVVTVSVTVTDCDFERYGCFCCSGKAKPDGVLSLLLNGDSVNIHLHPCAAAEPHT